MQTCERGSANSMDIGEGSFLALRETLLWQTMKSTSNSTICLLKRIIVRCSIPLSNSIVKVELTNLANIEDNKHVFIASGIVARVLYYESGLYAVRDEEEWRIHSLTIPTAITRCKPANWVAQSIRSRQSAKWEEAERNQTKPVWIDSSTQEGIPTELSTILSLPRCVSVRPSFINANGTLPESEDWLNHYNTAYELYDRPGTHLQIRIKLLSC